MTPARKPRTECCCHFVAVTREAIVAPAGVRSIAMMRACLVLDRATGFDDACAGRLREAGLPAFRAVERAAAFRLDLGLVMGSSEVHAAPSAAPPQPRPGKPPGRADPEACLSRSKSPQQRSDHARKPVISEQDSCSLAWIAPCNLSVHIAHLRRILGDGRDGKPMRTVAQRAGF